VKPAIIATAIEMRSVMFALAITAGAFLIAQPANAQCTYRMNNYGRFHGYLSGPCNGSALNLAGTYPARSNSAAPATSQVNGHGCVGRCPEKCQASWQMLGFRSVEACYVKWGKLNRLGIARQCEAANRARLAGQPKLPGC
jgi:hypothetical protein